MQLCLLHFDDALLSQPDFIAHCEQRNAESMDLQTLGAAVRLWAKTSHIDTVKERLKPFLENDEPRLCFMGSGDFHHMTALLLEAALEKRTSPITIVHFDNHPDWVRFEGGMHCGSWVNRALQHPLVDKIITIGVCSHDLRYPEWKKANLSLLTHGKLELFPYAHPPSRVRRAYGSGASHTQNKKHIHWHTIEACGEQRFIDTVLARIGTEDIYVTIDKDVLAADDAHTNWDQGIMRLPFLLAMLQSIGEHHALIGADVIGDYSVPCYSGTHWICLRKRAEIWLDQPYRHSSHASSASINSAGNRALLDVFSGIMQ